MFILLFMLLFNADVTRADTTAKDRCVVVDCTCRVVAEKDTGFTFQVKANSRRQLIFFNEDSDKILDSQKFGLTAFVDKFKNKYTDITLIGYTDGCGGKAYNRDLAARRVQRIKSAIEQDIPYANFNIVIHGEKVSGHSQEARRVDIIFHTNDSFMTKIEKVPADLYLIDASGSMWNGWRDWRSITEASLKPNSKVYVSMMRGCYNGQSLSAIAPGGGTEIWYSYWKVIDHMQPGQTLLIISDFDSNVPLSQRGASIIDQKVRAKQITVKYIK